MYQQKWSFGMEHANTGTFASIEAKLQEMLELYFSKHNKMII